MLQRISNLTKLNRIQSLFARNGCINRSFSANGNHASDSRSLRKGINAKYLIEDFVRKHGGREKIGTMSVKDVFEQKIYPKIKGTSLSYCEHLLKNSQKPDIAKDIYIPNYYLETVWNAEFMTVIDSLERYFQEYHTQHKAETAFIYFNAFSEPADTNFTPLDVYERISLIAAAGHSHPKVLLLLPPKDKLNLSILNDTWTNYRFMLYDLFRCPTDIVLSSSKGIHLHKDSLHSPIPSLQEEILDLFSFPRFYATLHSLSEVNNFPATQPLHEIYLNPILSRKILSFTQLEKSIPSGTPEDIKQIALIKHQKELAELQNLQQQQLAVIYQKNLNDKKEIDSFLISKNLTISNQNDILSKTILQSFDTFFHQNLYHSPYPQNNYTIHHHQERKYLYSQFVYNQYLKELKFIEKRENHLLTLLNQFEKQFSQKNLLTMKVLIQLFGFYLENSFLKLSTTEKDNHNYEGNDRENMENLKRKRELQNYNEKCHFHFKQYIENLILPYFLDTNHTELLHKEFNSSEIIHFITLIQHYNNSYHFAVERNIIKTESIARSIIELNKLYFGKYDYQTIYSYYPLLNLYQQQNQQMKQTFQKHQQQAAASKGMNNDQESYLQQQKQFEESLKNLEREIALLYANFTQENIHNLSSVHAQRIELNLLQASILRAFPANDKQFQKKVVKEQQIMKKLISEIIHSVPLLSSPSSSSSSSSSSHPPATSESEVFTRAAKLSEDDYLALIHVIDYVMKHQHDYETVEFLLQKLILLAQTDEQFVHSVTYLQKLHSFLFHLVEKRQLESLKKGEIAEKTSVKSPIAEYPRIYPFFKDIHLVQSPSKAIEIYKSLQILPSIIPPFIGPEKLLSNQLIQFQLNGIVLDNNDDDDDENEGEEEEEVEKVEEHKDSVMIISKEGEEAKRKNPAFYRKEERASANGGVFPFLLTIGKIYFEQKKYLDAISFFLRYINELKNLMQGQETSQRTIFQQKEQLVSLINLHEQNERNRKEKGNSSEKKAIEAGKKHQNESVKKNDVGKDNKNNHHDDDDDDDEEDDDDDEEDYSNVTLSPKELKEYQEIIHRLDSVSKNYQQNIEEINILIRNASVFLYSSYIHHGRSIPAFPYYQDFLKMKEIVVEDESFLLQKDYHHHFGDVAWKYNLNKESIYFMESLHYLLAHELHDLPDDNDDDEEEENESKPRTPKLKPLNPENDERRSIYGLIEYYRCNEQLARVMFAEKDYRRAMFYCMKAESILPEIEDSVVGKMLHVTEMKKQNNSLEKELQQLKQTILKELQKQKQQKS